MKEYSKIQSIFKRDEQTHKFILGEYSLPEFEYLAETYWIGTEKIDGTNMRVSWDGEVMEFGGRTDNAQIPVFLLQRMQELFTIEKFKSLYPDTPMALYGEGYGARVQKGGGNYISNGVDFILFDVLIDEWWLKREDIEDIANKLGIKVVPIVYTGWLKDAVGIIQNGLMSKFGDFRAEGMVLKPAVELKSRKGQRIMTKMKHKDFDVV